MDKFNQVTIQLWINSIKLLYNRLLAIWGRRPNCRNQRLLNLYATGNSISVREFPYRRKEPWGHRKPRPD